MRRRVRRLARLRHLRRGTPLRDLIGRRRLLALTAVALLGATAAVAYWTTHGAGTATGSVGALAAPSISHATGGQEAAALTWTTVTPPGSGEVKYYVNR